MVGWLAARSRAIAALALEPLGPACTQKVLSDLQHFQPHLMKMLDRQ